MKIITYLVKSRRDVKRVQRATGLSGNALRQEHDKPLHTAYLNYQNAFDSIPHSWLSKIIELYRIENQHL